MRVSVVIPCYNEEKAIASVVKKIPKGVFETIVVDNNSTDRSAELARRAGARVIKEKRQGYGAALKRGFASAQGDVIATLDADGQYPAHMVLGLARRLERESLDFISCSRFPLSNTNSIPFPRRLGNHALNLSVNALFGLRIKDSQSGMWVFRRGALEGLGLKSDEMPFSEELKVRVATNPKLKFAEFRIPYYERVGSSKLLPAKHGLMNMLFLFGLWLELALRKRN